MPIIADSEIERGVPKAACLKNSMTYRPIEIFVQTNKRKSK